MNSEFAHVNHHKSFNGEYPWMPSYSDIHSESASPWLGDKRDSSSTSSGSRNGNGYPSRPEDRGHWATDSFSFPERQGNNNAESGSSPSQEFTPRDDGLTDPSDYIESMFTPAASAGGPTSRKRLLLLHRMLAALCGRRDDVLHSLQGIRDNKLLLAEQKAAEEQRLIQALNARLRASHAALDARLTQTQAQADEMERHARQLAAVLRGKHAHVLADDTQWQSIEAQFQRLMRQPVQATNHLKARVDGGGDVAGADGTALLSDTWEDDGSSLFREGLEGAAAWDMWQGEKRALQARLSRAKESEARLQQELSQATQRLEGVSLELKRLQESQEQVANGSSKLARELDAKGKELEDARALAQSERSAREKATEELKAVQAKLDAMQAHEQALTTHLEQMRDRYTEAVQMLELRHRNELSELCEEHDAKQSSHSQRRDQRQPATPLTPALSPLQGDGLSKPSPYQASKSIGEAGTARSSDAAAWTPGTDPRHQHGPTASVPYSPPIVLGTLGGSGPLGGTWYQQLLSRIQLNHMKEKERIARRHQEEMARQAEVNRTAQPQRAATWNAGTSPAPHQRGNRESPGGEHSLNKSHAEVAVELSTALERRLREMEAENAELRRQLGTVAEESEVLVQYETYKVRSEMEAAMRQLELEPAHVARSYEQKLSDIKEAHESELASTRAEVARLAEALELRLQRSLADDGARAAEALVAKENSIRASNRHLQECLERRDEDFSQLLKQLHALQSMTRGGPGTTSSTTSSSGTLTSSPSSSATQPEADAGAIPERPLRASDGPSFSRLAEMRPPKHGEPTHDEESITQSARDPAGERGRDEVSSTQVNDDKETPAHPQEGGTLDATLAVSQAAPAQCTRCGVQESDNAGPCRFHPYFTSTAGPFLYSREWHACRVDRHQQGTLGCVELPEHHFRPSPTKNKLAAVPASPARVMWPSPSATTRLGGPSPITGTPLSAPSFSASISLQGGPSPGMSASLGGQSPSMPVPFGGLPSSASKSLGGPSASMSVSLGRSSRCMATPLAGDSVEDKSLSLNRRSSSLPSLQVPEASSVVSHPTIPAPRTTLPVPSPALASPGSQSFSFGMTPAASIRAFVPSPESVTSAAPVQKAGSGSYSAARQDLRGDSRLAAPSCPSGVRSADAKSMPAPAESFVVNGTREGGGSSSCMDADIADEVDSSTQTGSISFDMDGFGDATLPHGGMASQARGLSCSQESMGSKAVDADGMTASTGGSLESLRLRIPHRLVGPAQLCAGANLHK
eukprot:jgi/Mesvir1/15298/Mv06510-RA.1